MATPESGKDGKVTISTTSIGDTTKWTFNKDIVTSRYASSETSGYKKTITGVRHGAGALEGLWDSSAASTVIDGTSATLRLYTNATEYFSVPCKIKNFRLSVDINDGTFTPFTSEFETDGAWTEPTLS